MKRAIESIGGEIVRVVIGCMWEVERRGENEYCFKVLFWVIVVSFSVLGSMVVGFVGDGLGWSK